MEDQFWNREREAMAQAQNDLRDPIDIMKRCEGCGDCDDCGYDEEVS